ALLCAPARVARGGAHPAAEGDVVIPRVGDQLETMHGVYGKACLAPMEERRRAGRLKTVGFFDRVRVVEIPASEIAAWGDPAVVFMNVNTPDELMRARALAGERA